MENVTDTRDTVAAGYAACLSGALDVVADQEGPDMSESTVTADVTPGRTGSGFGLAVELTATIPGVDAETAGTLVEKAHEDCPYKATRDSIGVTVRAAS